MTVNKLFRLISSVVLLIIAIALIGFCAVSCKSEKKSDREICISSVKREVRAELDDGHYRFCPDEEFSVRKQDDGSYKVRAYVIVTKNGSSSTQYFSGIVRGSNLGDVTVIWG